MVGIVKEHMRKVLHGSKVGEVHWPYAAMYVTDVMRHKATHRLWTLPAFGEVVAITHPGPKKALDKRGQLGNFLYGQTWTNKVAYVLTEDQEGKTTTVRHGLHPVRLNQQGHLAVNLFEKPDEAAPTLQQWLTIQDPDGELIWMRKDGVTRRTAPFVVHTTDWTTESGEYDLVDVEDQVPLSAYQTRVEQTRNPYNKKPEKTQHTCQHDSETPVRKECLTLDEETKKFFQDSCSKGVTATLSTGIKSVPVAVKEVS